MLLKFPKLCSTNLSNCGFSRLGQRIVRTTQEHFTPPCRLENRCLHRSSSRTSLLSCTTYHRATRQIWDCFSLSFTRCKSNKPRPRGQDISKGYSTARSFNVNQIDGNVAQDTLIFSHKNDNFFKFLSIFGVSQMFMWGYLSLFSVQELRSGPVIKKDTSDLPWWQKMLYSEGRYKNAISILCFTLGASILFITLTYPRRAINKLWLLKGGQDVRITTYSWFGQTLSFKAPVEHISCIQSRTGPGTQVPFKVKNKSFFYLLDKQGSFHNAELFDFVIGLKRNL